MKLSSLSKTKNLLFITVETLSALFPNESKDNIKVRLSYLFKNKRILRLKKNLYVYLENYEAYKKYPEYLSVLACILKTPAYLSLEYVLRKYEILTEGTYGYTLVTTKTTATYSNSIGKFKFYNITDTLFTGYVTKKFLEFEYFEATKVKALFDWLYYRVNTISDEMIKNNLVEEFRLNLSSFSKAEKKELLDYAKLSAKFSSKMEKIIINIITNVSSN